MSILIGVKCPRIFVCKIESNCCLRSPRVGNTQEFEEDLGRNGSRMELVLLWMGYKHFELEHPNIFRDFRSSYETSYWLEYSWTPMISFRFHHNFLKCKVIIFKITLWKVEIFPILLKMLLREQFISSGFSLILDRLEL